MALGERAYDGIRWVGRNWRESLAVALLAFSAGALIWGVRYDVQKDREMRKIPYEMTPHSLVRCYNISGTLIYEDKLIDRAVEHRLMRLPCGYWAVSQCCISDPPKDATTDSRRWGVGYSNSEKVVDIDGRGIECVVIKNLNE